MRVLLLGGSGFIGRHVAAQLHAAGHMVAVFHRGNTPLPFAPEVQVIAGDRGHLFERLDEFRRWKPDVVVDFILSSGEHARMTRDVMRGIASRIVALSSGDVYRAMAVLQRTDSGDLEPVPLTENSRLRSHQPPLSPESLARVQAVFPWVDAAYDKVAVEGEIAAAPELPATILRLPIVYGPGDPLHRLHPWVKRFQDGRRVILLDKATARFVPCRGYVENVAHAIVLAVTLERAAGRIYNVAEPEAISEADWAARIGAAAGWDGQVIALERSQLPAALQTPFRPEQSIFMDSQRLREELGYRELIPEAEALLRTVEAEQRSPATQFNVTAFDYAAEDQALAAAQSAGPA